MPVLAIDLGGTKLATAVFAENGDMLYEERVSLEKRTGAAVGELISRQVEKFMAAQKEKGEEIFSIGISVPGIYYNKLGTVWAPNIPGWDNYPLLKEIKTIAPNTPVNIDSDRACYILGEYWKGNAMGCTDGIFLAVGTGIGAGILSGGKVLRGANDIAGAIGWMALEPPFDQSYKECGHFESVASGEGIAKLARKIIAQKNDYNGLLKTKALTVLTAIDVFDAYKVNDPVAQEVLHRCIEIWGMAIANLVSLFNPQKIIVGGGVFGSAVQFIPAIYEEAKKWAQPVSINQVIVEASALGSHAGLYGAGYLALQNIQNLNAC
jgi:glucokinase